MKIIVFIVLFGITIQSDFCLDDFKSIQLKEILSIGTLNDDLIFFVTSVVTDDEEFIYLTDSLDCALKKFDKNGILIKKTGRNGQGPGEFQFPVLIEYCNDMIYVVDQKRHGIQIFDKDLNYKTQFAFNLPIFDLEGLDDEHIFVLSQFLDSFPPILQLNIININKLTKLDSLKKKPEKNFWKSNGKFEIDNHGNIFFVSSFEDFIAKFDKDKKLIWEKTLLGGRTAKQKKTKTVISTFPTEMIYKDIALDKFGNSFILGGHVAEHRSRDIYVLDIKGNHLTTFILPEPSHFIYIDKNNFLYSIAGEGITLKKYFIEYVEK